MQRPPWSMVDVYKRQTLSGVAQAKASQEKPFYNLSLQMAIVTIATIPILLVYPFVQKYFTAGIMLGAVKG